MSEQDPTPVAVDAPSPSANPAEDAARRKVRANLIEATPGAAGQWILASPFLVFVGWLWIDIVSALLPLPWRWLAVVVSILLYLGLIVLPLGMLAHRIVTSLPRLFQNAGWDVQPLEAVRESEQYTVHYQPVDRLRAPRTWSRLWLRAAQGWVYLEIAALLIGAVLMIPLFLSASSFGFGR